MTKEAEDAWIELLLTGPGSHDRLTRLHARLLQQRGPGPAARPASCSSGYPQGAMAFFQYLDGWRRSGEFDGLTFRRAAAGGDSVDGRSVDDHDAAVTVDGESSAVDDGA